MTSNGNSPKAPFHPRVLTRKDNRLTHKDNKVTHKEQDSQSHVNQEDTRKERHTHTRRVLAPLAKVEYTSSSRVSPSNSKIIQSMYF